MKRVIPIVFALGMMGLSSSEVRAQAPESLEGAWEVVERAFTRGDSSWVVTDPQPGFYLFTETRYGVQEIRESGPRSDFDDSTDDMIRLAAFDVFHAHAGTYQIIENRLLVSPAIAKSPNTMNGSTYEYELQWSGDEVSIVRTALNEVRTTRLQRIE